MSPRRAPLPLTSGLAAAVLAEFGAQCLVVPASSWVMPVRWRRRAAATRWARAAAGSVPGL